MLSTGKRTSTKSTSIFTLISLIGIALTADFLWTSSSSPFFSIASNWAQEKILNLLVPESRKATEKRETVDDRMEEKYNVPERELSGTFADLPAPELEWEQMPSAPVPQLDGSAIQIEDLLYVFSGYGTLDHVHSHVDVSNFTAKKWTERFNTPCEMALSHLGVASDGRRYVYIVSGQHGSQCTAPPISLSFLLDTNTEEMEELSLITSS